jgi:transcription initiation factor TFIID TATA-box-binding protein
VCQEPSQELAPNLTIVNVVATAELGQSVSLEELIYSSGFVYDEAIYHCAYLKDDRTIGKVCIFATGKMICIGTRSLDAAKHDLAYAARKLADLGLVKATQVAVKPQNIVATSRLGRAVDVKKASAMLPNIVYRPEQFPGAIYHAKELEGASILIFASGRIVFAGLKSRTLPKAKDVLKKLAQQLPLGL